ncbi:MAG: hypothetical protein IPK18_00410 [Sphingobacteriales bacterium]|nr:MAG: hypothetical protein IPK18_00410 [Sphingobacteriales bacterium]
MFRSIISVVFLFSFFHFYAQNVDSASLAENLKIKTKKFNPEKVRILFGMNYTYAIPTMIQNDLYSGEYKIKLDTFGGINLTEFIEYDDKRNLRKITVHQIYKFHYKPIFGRIYIMESIISFFL